MRLRVPGVEVQNISAAVGFGLVRGRIFLRERSEQANPAPLEVQSKSVVDGVARFMPEDAHAFDVGAAFDFAHELALDLHQAGMREIKRDGKARYAVRREPFGRQPHVRLKANAAIIQLAVETFDVRLDEGTLDANRQVRNARV